MSLHFLGKVPLFANPNEAFWVLEKDADLEEKLPFPPFPLKMIKNLYILEKAKVTGISLECRACE